VAYLYKGVLFSNNKEQTANKYNMYESQNHYASERSLIQNNTYSIIPFIWSYRPKKLLCWKMKMDHAGSFWDNRNCVCLDKGLFIQIHAVVKLCEYKKP
jgi:hypothetical protein